MKQCYNYIFSFQTKFIVFKEFIRFNMGHKTNSLKHMFGIDLNIRKIDNCGKKRIVHKSLGLL